MTSHLQTAYSILRDHHAQEDRFMADFLWVCAALLVGLILFHLVLWWWQDTAWPKIKEWILSWGHH